MVRHAGGRLHALGAYLEYGEEHAYDGCGQDLILGDHGDHEALEVVVVADAGLVDVLGAVDAEHADEAAHHAGDEHGDDDDLV